MYQVHAHNITIHHCLSKALDLRLYSTEWEVFSSSRPDALWWGLLLPWKYVNNSHTLVTRFIWDLEDRRAHV